MDTGAEIKISIKNMVCPRCIESVNSILEELKLSAKSIILGQATLDRALSEAEKNLLDQRLRSKGFELINDSKTITVSNIKAIIVNQIHYNPNQLKNNFSTLLSDKLNHSYPKLSRLFTEMEGKTIEKFILNQKIEKVKELISYDQYSISEIAHHLNYSSVAHLSSQFKKATGVSPSHYKRIKDYNRNSLDKI
ncbi:MAG: AraC family transcriptional regulator [Bacteroidota bacterium]